MTFSSVPAITLLAVGGAGEAAGWSQGDRFRTLQKSPALTNFSFQLVYMDHNGVDRSFQSFPSQIACQIYPTHRALRDNVRPL